MQKYKKFTGNYITKEIMSMASVSIELHEPSNTPWALFKMYNTRRGHTCHNSDQLWPWGMIIKKGLSRGWNQGS